MHASIAVAATIPAAAQSNAAPAQDDVETALFRTPSKQINCMFWSLKGKPETTKLSCEINQTFIRRPVRPRPPGCDGDWGHMFEVDDAGTADLACVTDSVQSDDSPSLPYGSSVSRGSIVCASEEGGLTCRNGKGRGFFLSRRDQKIF
jgi:hypothetical protein